MQIGIIGKGNVGSTLGRLWARCGHEILFGLRDPKSPATLSLLATCGENCRALDVREVFSRTQLVLLAVRWEDVPAVLGEVDSLNGTILIDCITPFEPSTRAPLLDWTLSAAERLSEWAKGARIVKCFDTTGVKVMEHPEFGGVAATMFLCGDSIEAKELVQRLAEELGFECIDVGPLSSARYLEALSAFWVFLAYERDLGRDFAFKLLRR